MRLRLRVGVGVGVGIGLLGLGLGFVMLVLTSASLTIVDVAPVTLNSRAHTPTVPRLKLPALSAPTSTANSSAFTFMLTEPSGR